MIYYIDTTNDYENIYVHKSLNAKKDGHSPTCKEYKFKPFKNY